MRKQKFRTATSRDVNGLPKIKKRPRGRPFEKGNTLSLPYRFKKGVSGNPSGRPKCKEISKALRERLESDTPLAARTYAEKVAKEWTDLALHGNIAAIVSLANRDEGCPATTIVSDGPNPLDLILVEMTKRSDEVGLPEGMLPVEDRLLEAAPEVNQSEQQEEVQS